MIDVRAITEFDAAKVQAAADRTRRIALLKGADAIRDTARDSMPARGGLAPAGQPPHMKSTWLKRAVLAAWDRRTQTAVVGPTREVGWGGQQEQFLMEVLEHGGQYELGKNAKRRRKIRQEERVVVTVQPKPYMGPAAEAATAAGTIQDAWSMDGTAWEVH